MTQQCKPLLASSQSLEGPQHEIDGNFCSHLQAWPEIFVAHSPVEQLHRIWLAAVASRNYSCREQ